jgi:hypothetical protein
LARALVPSAFLLARALTEPATPLASSSSDAGSGVGVGAASVVTESFAWLSRYRRLNTIFERSKEHLIAFVAITFISILARRLKRLVTEALSA